MPMPAEKSLDAAGTQQSEAAEASLLHKLLFCCDPDHGIAQGSGISPGILFTTPLPCPDMLSLGSPCTGLSDLIAFSRNSGLASPQKAVHTLLTMLLSCPPIKIKLYLMHTTYFAVKETSFPNLLSEAIYLAH